MDRPVSAITATPTTAMLQGGDGRGQHGKRSARQFTHVLVRVQQQGGPAEGGAQGGGRCLAPGRV
jgi:hypothetical protein